MYFFENIDAPSIGWLQNRDLKNHRHKIIVLMALNGKVAINVK
jgi:hypothetical protein